MIEALSKKEIPEASMTQSTDRLRQSNRGAIHVDKVSVEFKRNGQAFSALAPVDLNVEAGAFVSFLGPSGCGKTTLLNVISGMLRPTTGSVQIDDTPVTRPIPLCNVVFQQHSLFPWMKVIDNVAFGPQQLGDGDPEGTARTFLSLVGLDKFATLYPAQLSGGMQQRVAIARALATYPPVLLMDEPFGALDAQTRTIMQEELLKIWANFSTTVIFVTHDIDEAIYLSDRIVVMRTAPGSVKEVIDVPIPRPRTPKIMQSEVFSRIRLRVIDLIREETLKIFNSTER
ncbi:MAG: sulfonate ABC transporter ATP-binding protein [Hydrogenophilales bacterium 16-64-46]|nr:MAG: sulfonate ABC transporter ATP-binding protein [Hydrogenophilales bacterium 12-64-13]OYZ05477.1 MAG: sulfonate ABC transporter ATP-binding protein [Hydrogenophilales bacterium 16-64-46]OZA40057.1 MAG: sulfonate ABC transporter ATP-binding protein [Hydrogenophilales bacterium 17-64-34]HQT00925.1 ABC transporter ATP-binding protein [Thiobacillus sp.]